jgi:glycine/D-amino acid oxidase-like deaminating enzyme
LGGVDVASYHHWPHRIEKYGAEEAIVMSKFESRHPAVLVALAKKYNLDCDVKEVDTVDAYYDHDGFERAKAAALAISQYIPDLIHKIYDGEEAQEKFRVSTDCIGAITYPAGQLWPYKLVTQLVEILVEKGVNLQTETPVTKITKEGDKWLLRTPRGDILTSKVVHATNGYAQYLLPAFSTIIKPTRGHMTAQLPPKSLSDPPLNRTYSFIYEDGKFDYFIQQPAYDGCKLMLGGGYYQDPHVTTYDDSEAPKASQQYLYNQLPKVFRWEDEDDPEKRIFMGWSGIMGFSEDGFPWVGPLSESFGGGIGQWICAGYTGEGLTSSLLY